MKNRIVVIYVLITLVPVAIGVMTHLDHVADREALEACIINEASCSSTNTDSIDY